MTFLNAINNSVRRNSSTGGQAVSFTALLWRRNCQTVVASVVAESLLQSASAGILSVMEDGLTINDDGRENVLSMEPASEAGEGTSGCAPQEVHMHIARCNFRE